MPAPFSPESECHVRGSTKRTSDFRDLQEILQPSLRPPNRPPSGILRPQTRCQNTKVLILHLPSRESSTPNGVLDGLRSKACRCSLNRPGLLPDVVPWTCGASRPFVGVGPCAQLPSDLETSTAFAVSSQNNSDCRSGGFLALSSGQ